MYSYLYVLHWIILDIGKKVFLIWIVCDRNFLMKFFLCFIINCKWLLKSKKRLQLNLQTNPNVATREGKCEQCNFSRLTWLVSCDVLFTLLKKHTKCWRSVETLLLKYSHHEIVTISITDSDIVVHFVIRLRFGINT